MGQTLKGSLLKHPLIFFLPFFLLGCILGKVFTVTSFYLLNLLFALFLCFFSSLRQFSFVLLVFCLAALWQTHFFHPPIDEGKRNITYYLGQKLTLKAEVEQVNLTPEKEHLVLKNLVIFTPLPQPVKGKIRIIVYNPFCLYQIGDVLCFEVSLKPIRSFAHPGQVDTSTYWHGQGIWVQAYITGEKINLCGHKNPFFIKAWLEEYRNKIRIFLAQHLSQPSLGVYQTLLLGEKQLLFPQIRDEIRFTGTSHLLAISGLHLGMVMTIFFTLFWYLFSRSEWCLLRFQVKRLAAFFALIPTFFYACLVHLSPATSRAFLMLLLFWWLYFSRRLKNTWLFLAAAAWCLLLLHPPLLFRISFQLSFVALASILFLTPRLYQAITHQSLPSKRQIKNFSLFKKSYHYLFLTFIASLAAWLGTLPLVLHYFSGISLISPLINPLVIPLIGFFILPVGLLAIFCLPLFPSLSQSLLRCGEKAISFLLAGLHKVTSLPGVFIYTPLLNWAEVGCIYLLMLCFFLLSKRYLPHLALATLCLFTFVLGYYFHKHHKFSVTFYDVGQGSSIFLQFPEGKTILIGAGGSRHSLFDPGKSIVARALWAEKYLRLDWLIIPAPKPGYINGLPFIASHFHPKAILSISKTIYNSRYWELFYLCQQRHIPILTPDFLPQMQVIGNVILRRLGDGFNLECVYKGIKFLFLFQKDSFIPYGKLHVLFIGHRKISLSFIQKIKPYYVVFSGSRRPPKWIIRYFQQIGSQIFFTYRDGMIRFVTEGNYLKVKTSRFQTNK